MPNWYLNQKLKKKVKDIMAPAVMMTPLSLVGLLPNTKPQQPPTQPPASMSPMIQNVPAAPNTTTQPAIPQPATKPVGKSNIIEMLKRHEGYSEKVYMDTKGIPTIGIGFNLRRPDAKAKLEALGYNYESVLGGKQAISKDAVLKLFSSDVAQAKKDIAGAIPNLGSLPQAVQDVLTDMMFNMGSGTFGNFQKMIAAVNAKDYAKAADEMKNSKWYGQVGNRGPELADLMRSAVASPSAPQITK